MRHVVRSSKVQMRNLPGLAAIFIAAFLMGTPTTRSAFGQGDARGAPAQLRDPVTSNVLRSPDTRPARDAAAVEAARIGKFESRRLILYSDLPQDQVSGLPAMMDQVYGAWESYLKPLPANPQRTEFQMTGFLFRDESRFAAAGLLPENLPNFTQGRHRGQEFWLKDPDADYYRRHLVIHEATHCYMTAVPYPFSPPTWYLEGMAEYFATHRLTEDGRITCGVFPDRPENFRGLGRIETIQDEVRAGRQLNVLEVGEITNEQFAADRSVPYAWSWALCAFLDGHPRFRERFRALGGDLEGRAFQSYLSQAFQKDRILLAAEFHEFTRRITYGYDFGRNAFTTGNNYFTLSGDVEIKVLANSGWQDTGRAVYPGQLVELTASGSVELSQAPAAWLCEPQGITYRYCDGVPVGALLGGLLPLESALEPGEVPRLQTGFIGTSSTLTVTRPSRLFFRVNDFANEIAGNVGSYLVKIHPVPTPQE